MSRNANNIPQKVTSTRPLDDFDRKILGALTKDARLSYAEIGKQVALSAPAVHERVKRLIASGTINSWMALELVSPSWLLYI